MHQNTFKNIILGKNQPTTQPTKTTNKQTNYSLSDFAWENSDVEGNSQKNLSTSAPFLRQIVFSARITASERIWSIDFRLMH